MTVEPNKPTTSPAITTPPAIKISPPSTSEAQAKSAALMNAFLEEIIQTLSSQGSTHPPATHDSDLNISIAQLKTFLDAITTPTSDTHQLQILLQKTSSTSGTLTAKKDGASGGTKNIKKELKQLASLIKQNKAEFQALVNNPQDKKLLQSIASANFISALNKFIFGNAMSGVMASLKNAQADLSFENRMLNHYMRSIVSGVAGAPGHVTWGGTGTVQQSAFNKDIANLNNNRAGFSNWFNANEQKIEQMKGAAAAAGQQSIEQMASKLLQKLSAAHAAFEGLMNLGQGNQNNKTKISAFNAAMASLEGAIKGDGSTLVSASTQAQSKLQLQITFYQEFWNNLASLMKTLSHLMSVLSSKVGGQ